MWRLAGRSAGKARRLVSVLKGEVFTSHYELFKCRVALSDVAAACPTPLPPFLFLSFFISFFLSFYFFLSVYLLLVLNLTPYTLYTHIDLNTHIKAYSSPAHILYDLISLHINLHTVTHRNTHTHTHTHTQTLYFYLSLKSKTHAVKLKMPLSIFSSMFGQHTHMNVGLLCM